MKTPATPANPSPRPLRVRRWRTILAGGVLAGVGFVAAQAGSIDFIQLQLNNLAKAVDDKPVSVRASAGGERRSYSTTSPGSPASSLSASGIQRSAAQPGAGLTFASQDGQTAGEARVDAVDLFELSSFAGPTSVTASQDPLQFGGRFHALIDGAGSPSDRPSYGSSGRRAADQKDLANCCSDPETQPGDPLLTAPTLADAVNGPVPEPGAWALLILGLGLSGVALRSERRRLA